MRLRQPFRVPQRVIGKACRGEIGIERQWPYSLARRTGCRGPHVSRLLPLERRFGRGYLRRQGQEPTRPPAPVRHADRRSRKDPAHDAARCELRLHRRRKRAHEALVLERELIAQYHPYFNVDYKDDKSYPYIAITRGDVFPAIKYTREKHRPDTRYYGPYTDSRAARETIDTLRKVCPICTASCAEWKRVRRLLEKRPDDADVIELICSNQGRPCFDYHVGAGPAYAPA